MSSTVPEDLKQLTDLGYLKSLERLSRQSLVFVLHLLGFGISVAQTTPRHRRLLLGHKVGWDQPHVQELMDPSLLDGRCGVCYID